MNLTVAKPGQLDALCRALAAAGLPHSDLTTSSIGDFLVEQVGAEVTRSAGLEVHGDFGLVRSITVVEGQRRNGEGARLLAELERHAGMRGVRVLYLLTTTAAPFFTRHGYAVTDRADAPPSLQATAEFAALCPASAICMKKALG